MHDRTLIALALATSSLGLAGLLLTLTIAEPTSLGINDAKATADDTPLRITGTLERATTRGSITTLVISEPATIDVILFDANVTIEHGACIIVEGKRSSYEGRAQIAAQRITRCATY